MIKSNSDFAQNEIMQIAYINQSIIMQIAIKIKFAGKTAQFYEFYLMF